MKRYILFNFFVINFSFSEKPSYRDRFKSFTSDLKVQKIIRPMSYLRDEYSDSDKHKKIDAEVKSGITSTKEDLVIKKRRSAIAQEITKQFCAETDETRIPNIGICISGGGYRSMIGTLGFLKGFEDSGLLNTIEYISVLSGSSWAVAGWLSSGETLDNFSQKIKNKIKDNPMLLKKISTLPAISKERTKQLAKALGAKFVFQQPISAIDIYGAMVTDNILDNLELKISSQKEILESKNMFMPLYTAVSPLSKNHPIDYSWYEFNPYVMRNLNNNNYIPIWAFGRKFESGKSEPSPGLTKKIYPPELALSNFMGIFGSAFAANGKDAIRFIRGQIPDLTDEQIKRVDKLIATDEKILNISNLRISVADIFNPEYKVKNGTNPKNKLIHFLDGGADFNMPIAPLLKSERKMDIIIMFDITGQYKPNTPALRDSEKYARKKNIKFPKIDYKNLDSKEISIFKEDDAPTIIYIPFINDCLDSFGKTINFCYKENEFDYVFNRAREIVKNVECEIRKEILGVVEKKSR